MPKRLQHSLLHDDADRQATRPAPIASALLDALSAEHVEPRQPRVGALDVVGIVFLAGRQVSHIGDEGRIHALGALNRGRAVGGLAAGIDHERGVDRVAVVGGLDAPLDDFGLRHGPAAARPRPKAARPAG